MSALIVAEAAARFANQPQDRRPVQLAVLGPTQTGKSTVVNWIIGRPCAVVSPLAGFTVQPQGFSFGTTNDDWLAPLLADWERMPPLELSRERLNVLGFERAGVSLPHDFAAVAQELTIWDTPDFDSLAAGDYRAGLLEVAAFADCLVLVVSKEKYADLAVWKMLSLLAGLEQPLILCLNKQTADGGAEVLASLRARLDGLGAWGRASPIAAVPYLSEEQRRESAASDAIQQMRAAAGDVLGRGSQFERGPALQRWLRRDWDKLTEPLRVEHATLTEFRRTTAQAVAASIEHYRRDFLDHPQRYDSFRRATLELLRLLELPGVGGAVGRMREVLTYPARKLVAWGRSLSSANVATGGQPGYGEQQVLDDLIDRLLTQVEHEALRHSDPNAPGWRVWRRLAERLRNERPAVEARFRAATAEHIARFADEIHATARQLHAYLRERPAVLNSLRAARTFTDVASIAVAIKTGGTVGADLLFAPALLGLTSSLTEGALGAYMQSAAADLKEKQFRQVCGRLFDGIFARELLALADRLAGPDVLGISERELADATQALRDWSAA